jgi:pimeloyl-ACP methyl ester carboxylesterase
MKKNILSTREKAFIISIFGPQLEKELTIELQIGNLDERATVKYCIISDNPTDDYDKEIIVLLAGFGSGWTGVSMLAYYLAELGYKVCMLSLPGYGNSPNPEIYYYSSVWKFFWHGETLAAFAKQVFPGKELHWIGHSMGAAILAKFAKNHDELVKSLMFLNPVGFKARKPFELSAKFLFNGLLHSLAFHGDPVWAELKKYLPAQKSPFTKERLPQRVSELNLLCEGSALEYLSKIHFDVELAYLTAEWDFVEPCNSERFKMAHKNTSWYHLRGVFHNATMLKSDLTAEHISTFIESLS